MTRRLTQAQKDAKLDDQKWESSLAFVRAYNEWQTAQKTYGPFSTKALDAYKVAVKAMKTYNRLAIK